MVMTATTYAAATAAVTTAGLFVSLSVSYLKSVRINELEGELGAIKGYNGISERDAKVIKSGVVGKTPIKERPEGPKTTEPREEPETPEENKRRVAPNTAD